MSKSFINFMDAIKLKYRAKDQLYPMLQELMTGYAKFKASKDWEGRGKMVSWCVFILVAPSPNTDLPASQADPVKRHEGLR